MDMGHWSIAGAIAQLRTDVIILAWLLAEEKYHNTLPVVGMTKAAEQQMVEDWHGKARSDSANHFPSP